MFCPRQAMIRRFLKKYTNRDGLLMNYGVLIINGLLILTGGGILGLFRIKYTALKICLLQINVQEKNPINVNFTFTSSFKCMNMRT